MNTNICNNCGGDYVRDNGRWRCPYCGSYKPEEISNEEVTLLYTAFQKLRLAEFQEAELEFDDIIHRYPENANAYWGRLMAKHGAKFEEDFDGRRIPTCYATSIDSVMDDEDYRKALKYADKENKCYYQEKAEYMERVRKEWLEKASKEKPYDVFICYKDSDAEKGIERTDDSIAAQDIYTHLTDLGYHVFYSHVSLQGKVGEKYEPYIFNALSTAKVMLVYGSSPEYINSTWLKNEWMRYAKRIQSGEKQQDSLLVACDGFSPNELPHALSSMQCFDAKEKTFYGQLEKTVHHFVHGDEEANDEPVIVINQEKKSKSKAPVFITLFLLLAAIGGFLAWNFLSGGFSMTISNASQNATVISHSGTFPKGTEFYMEEISADESLKAKIATITTVHKKNYHLYDMELRNEGNVLNINGNITVTIPLPSGIPADKAVVYYMSGSAPQKISSQVSDGKISFVTNHFSIYMVAEEIEVCNHVIVTDYAVSATCTKDGLTEGRHCSLCAEVLVEQTVIPAAHTPGPAANCTNGQHCTVCRAELNAALGHTPGAAATCTTAQTCTVCHTELMPAKGHKPGAMATCTTAQTCTVCNAQLKEALGHTPGAAATCTTAQTCKTCHAELVSAKGHKPGTASTCTTAQTCTVCHEELMPAKGHKPGAAATCTTAQTCTVCNAELESAKGHTPDDGATCEKPSKCIVCNEILDAAELHIPGAEATCTTAQTCTVCNTELTPAKGHTPGAEATCTTPQYCVECKTELLPAKGHTPGAEATCTTAQECTVCHEEIRAAKGHKRDANAICTEPSDCTVCGARLEPKGPHTPGSAATCTTAQTCTVCHVELQAAKGHTPGEAATCTTAQKCTSCGATVQAALGHTEVIDPAIPATPESTGLTEGKHCSVCNTVLVKQEVVIYGNGSQGLAYEVNSDGKTCTITGIGICTDTVIHIPDMYNGYTVTAIGERAFSEQTKITAIHLPDTIKTIGARAFYGCTGLTEFTIPASVTNIGTQIIYKCTNLETLYYRSDYYSSSNPFVYQSSLKKVVFEGTRVRGGFLSGCSGITEIVIGDSVTVIEDSAFKNCTGLTSVTLGKGLTTIGSSSFLGCTILKDIMIPNNVQKINSSAFEGCSVLESVTLGTGLTTIGSSAFKGCVALKNIVIHDNVETINDSAFYGCTVLKSVTLGTGLTSIGNSAFYGCTVLTDIVIPGNVKTLGSSAFYGCNALTSIVIPNSVTRIGSSVFYGCTALASVTISNGITIIPSSAFQNCVSLTSITIPDSVITIDSSAFQGCNALRIVIVPDSVTAIGQNAFRDCTMLMSVTIPSSVMRIDSNAFYGCYRLTEVANQSVLAIKVGDSSYGYIAYYAKEVHDGEMKLMEVDGLWFYPGENKSYLAVYIGNAAELVLPKTYENKPYDINAYAFYHCSSLVSITIPDGVTSIGKYAFGGCSGLTSITIPNTVTSIGVSAFSGCSGLTSMTIPFVGGSASAEKASSSTLFGYIFGDSSYEGGTQTNQSYGYSYSYYIPTGLKTVTVTGGSLLYGAFYNCSMLESITIPGTVTKIEANVFYNCSGLKSVYYAGTLAQWSSMPFGNVGSHPCRNGAQLYIGDVALAGDIVIPDGVTSISSYAFYNCKGLTSVVIPNSVTSIGASAFSGCSGLTSMTIPFVGGSASATEASGSTLFGYIFGTSSYEGGKSTKQSYGSYYSDYYIPTGLKTVTVTGGKLFYGAFYNCSGLTSVTLGDGVTDIGESAFYNCSGLIDIQYTGTTAQWNSLPFGSNWNNSTGNYTIHCTDGTISKDGTVTPK